MDEKGVDDCLLGVSCPLYLELSDTINKQY